jgi:hypothetical protein
MGMHRLCGWVNRRSLPTLFTLLVGMAGHIHKYDPIYCRPVPGLNLLRINMAHRNRAPSRPSACVPEHLPTRPSGCYLQHLMRTLSELVQLMHENKAQPWVQPMLPDGLKMRLQCRKTLPVQQYCRSHNWSYNARVLKVWQPFGEESGRRRRPD